ncbi:hypothetical protein [Parablautia muri]|uniref:hypothetical protein n=1 Tax=Parablautia muri TaxID=2320879 RepID=UPI00241298A0|nr:hypothetical protein [Parablautia muri]
MLRIITDKPDLIIINCEIQKDMKRLAGARSICLDAYGTDSTGKKYDLEQSLSLKKIVTVRAKQFIRLRESTLQRVNLLKMGSISFM